MSERLYPDKLEIVPLAKAPHATVRVPGSKSITNRAMVLAALASKGQQSVCLSGSLYSEDTDVMRQCLAALSGIQFAYDSLGIMVRPPTFDPSSADVDLFVGNSGTTIRFLTALCCLECRRCRLDGIPRMRERPIEPLLDGLRQLGADAFSENENGCPPVVINATGRLAGGRARIDGSTSSQFASALLMIAPYADCDTEIETVGSQVSEPYLQMTTEMMRQFGVVVTRASDRSFYIRAGQHYRQTHYRIEPDASSASYFLAAATIANGSVTIPGLSPQSIQGDLQFASALVEMGATIEWEDAGITIRGRAFRGIEIDMNAISDTVMTLAAVACFAEGPTTIRNVAHIRHKESDRIAAMATELRKVGAEVEEFPDGMRITPRPLHGAEIDTYNDHRIAMSMALIGLKVPGIVIKNPGCVAKTYPGFWDDLEKLRD